MILREGAELHGPRLDLLLTDYERYERKQPWWATCPEWPHRCGVYFNDWTAEASCRSCVRRAREEREARELIEGRHACEGCP